MAYRYLLKQKRTFNKLVGNGGDVLGKKVCGEGDKPHYYAGCD